MDGWIMQMDIVPLDRCNNFRFTIILAKMRMAKMTFLLVLSCVLPTFSAVPNTSLIWPMPESVECLQGPEIALSPKLRFDILNSSTIASAAVDRYTPLLRPARTSIAQFSRVATLASVTISWSIASDNLTSDTNYSYNLRCCTTDPNGGLNARVFAASVFGVGYALETLVQLADGNGSGGDTIPCGGGFSVVDHPVYRHRGLMVDTGRRYYPIPLLHSTLDAMSAFKMNVLHFHLSEVKKNPLPISISHFNTT